MNDKLTANIDLRRADDRFKTRIGWLDSKHSFSFGHHRDPNNTHHGLLLVSNDDIVTAGAGFDTHPHRDMEIITWVLQGSLVHQDSEGNNGVIYPGLAQRMSAGTGIFHSEKNDAWRAGVGEVHNEAVRFIQMWIVPDETGIKPGYEQADVDDHRLRSGLVTVASGMDQHANETAIRIKNRHAALHVARLQPANTVSVPDAPYTHIFVARGIVDLEGAGTLNEGDAVRLTGIGGQSITAIDDAEVLIWEMHATAA
jgi:quercetin 2,3-dioxygenase